MNPVVGDLDVVQEDDGAASQGIVGTRYGTLTASAVVLEGGYQGIVEIVGSFSSDVVT